MLDTSRERIEALPGDAVVLDVGGWADPLERADWVIDVMPHATRGLYGREGWGPERDGSRERFTAETWVQRDLCDSKPWPFDDDSFDFVVCSHTLEDLRDPLRACEEIRRVGRAGYCEVPSRLEEQSFGVYGDFVGWPHHHWLIDVAGDHMEFVFKDAEIHARPDCYFPKAFWMGLTEDERTTSLWWEGSFTCAERLFLEERPQEAYLPDLVRSELARRPSRPPGSRLSRRRRRGGS